jgi:hypothetical protein
MHNLPLSRKTFIYVNSYKRIIKVSKRNSFGDDLAIFSPPEFS